MSRRIIIQIVIGAVIVALLLGGIIAIQFFRTPLAPQLTVVPTAESFEPIPTATLNPEQGTESVMTLTDIPTPEVQSTPEPTAIPTPMPGICGGVGSSTILLTGKDAGYFQPPYGADAIRLVKVDYVGQKIAVFSIPRNLVVTTGALVNYGYNEARLGDAYQIIMDKESQAADVDIKATSALAQIILENFGVLPDHYVTLKSTLIKDIVNTIGGIEVDVPAAIDSPTLRLDAGPQRLDGQTTQEYLRYREESATSEWNRIPRQDQVIRGLQRKLLSPAVLLQAPELLNQFRYGVTTDMSVEQLMGLSCMMQSVPDKDVTFESINPNDVTVQDDNSMIMVDKDLVKREFMDVFGPGPVVQP